MSEEFNVERWKTAMLTAPDEQFFQTMRVYLGDIKTPFNKHDLIERLTAFLRKPETQDRIISLLDSQDASILTAIVLLGAPTMARLYTLFEGTVGYLKLHYRVLNLEERMLVYRYDDDGAHTRLRIHPLLEESIADRVVDPRLLFDMEPVDPIVAPLTRPTDARIVATATFIASSRSILKSDGDVRKRTAEDYRELFHEQASKMPTDRFIATVHSLLRLGAASRTNGAVQLNSPGWKRLCRLDPEDRVAYLVAPGDHGVREEAEAIRSLLEALPVDHALDGESFGQVARMNAGYEMDETETERIEQSLERFGLIAHVEGNRIVETTPAAVGSEEEPAVIQPTFEITVPLTVSAHRAWFLPFVTELRSFDTVSRYEITRDACSRGFAAGLTAESIVDLLHTLCRNEVPQNIKTSLSLWEQEFRGIRMLRGTVVVADSDRRHVFDYDEQIQALVHERLAPGVYLVLSRDIEPLRDHLHRAGIEPVPDIADIDADERSTPEDDTVFGPLEHGEPVRIPTPDAGTAEHRSPSPPFDERAYRAEVASFPEAHELSKEQEVELGDRIDRRLVLFPKQVKHVQPVSELVEAKGFDYLGKVRLVEQALSRSDDLLEILASDADGEPSTMVVKPDSLEKEGSELVLVGRTFSEDKPVRIRVRSIGFLRRRRGSIIG